MDKLYITEVVYTDLTMNPLDAIIVDTVSFFSDDLDKMTLKWVLPISRALVILVL